MLEKVKIVSESLFEYLLKDISIDIKSLRFDKAWELLPSSTTRGMPFHDIGKNVDSRIIEIGGSTSSTALAYFKSSSQNVCFPGWRIQGAQWPGPAKIRIVNIPQVSYQYLMTGLTKELMAKLKSKSMFAG